MGPIEEKAFEILCTDWCRFLNQPASLSGKYHNGKSMLFHLLVTVVFMELLCKAHQITGVDRDILRAAAWLHDLGKFVISMPGRSANPSYTYYECGWSRADALMELHPILSAAVVGQYPALKHNKKIQRLVSVHMNKFYPDTPRPVTLHENLICEADFLANKLQ